MVRKGNIKFLLLVCLSFTKFCDGGLLSCLNGLCSKSDRLEDETNVELVDLVPSKYMATLEARFELIPKGCLSKEKVKFDCWGNIGTVKVLYASKSYCSEPSRVVEMVENARPTLTVLKIKFSGLLSKFAESDTRVIDVKMGLESFRNDNFNVDIIGNGLTQRKETIGCDEEYNVTDWFAVAPVVIKGFLENQRVLSLGEEEKKEA